MQDFGAALALLLIIEGILPFISPTRFRETVRTMLEMSDKTLRTVGIISMITGLVVLYLVRM